jgi:tryptophan 2,3-dioxygenase
MSEPANRSGCPFGELPPVGITENALNYNDYLKVEQLKNLQICMSDPAHHDEPLFIIIHQTYELWFKLILHELDLVIEYLNKDRIRRANFFMKRVNAIMKLLVQQIHILETMTPMEFLGFRNSLNPASGFQSTQFREIEIVGGLKDKKLMAHFDRVGDAYAKLAKRNQEPGLGDVFYSALRRKGFILELTPEKDTSATDSNSQHQPEQTTDPAQESRLQELRKIYEHPEEFLDYHDFAESLIDFDESLALWRSHHATVVERVIGFKRGTGGSEGVQYLRSTLNKRCFPDLWKVRTVLQYREIDY